MSATCGSTAAQDQETVKQQWSKVTDAQAKAFGWMGNHLDVFSVPLSGVHCGPVAPAVTAAISVEAPS
jgi:hypothetical protein